MTTDTETTSPEASGASGGWLQIGADKRQSFWLALAGAVLLVVGGFGPWVKFGPFSAAGTEGDGWFLIVGGVVAGALLVRLNSRKGERDRLTWLIPIAGAVGGLVVLVDLIEILETELVSVGWGAWVGAAAGVLLVGASLHLLLKAANRAIIATLASAALAGVGIAAGISSADDTGSMGSSDEAGLFEAGDAEEERPPAPTIEVEEQGFGQGDGEISYGAVLRNPSRDLGATDVTVTVNFLDEAGTVIATEAAMVARIPPDSVFGVAGASLIEGEEVAELEVTAEAESGDDAPAELPRAGEVRLIDSDYGRQGRVEVTNTTSERLSSIADVFFIFRDDAGRIIGGEQTFPDADVRPGAKTAVEAFSVPEAAARGEVYVDAEV